MILFTERTVNDFSTEMHFTIELLPLKCDTNNFTTEMHCKYYY